MEILKSVLKDFYFSRNAAAIGPAFSFGMELEFPLLPLDGSPPDELVLQKLLTVLSEEYQWDPICVDIDGQYVKAKDAHGTIISYEACYGILEFSFPPRKTIVAMEALFKELFSLVISFLYKKGLTLIAIGLNPFSWSKQLSPLKTAYMQMIYDFSKIFHPSHGQQEFFYRFTCANQLHLDVTAENAVDIVNVCNAITWAKALLFANSFSVHEENKKYLCMRDIYYKENALGFNARNVGPDDRFFIDLDDLLSHQTQKSIFHVVREEEYIFFKPRTIQDFFGHSQVCGYVSEPGKEIIQKNIVPSLSDLYSFRTYNHASLTKRGTVEIRSECQQPFSDIMTSAAFHIGLLFNIEKTKKYIFQQHAMKEGYCCRRYDAVCQGYDIQRSVSFDVCEHLHTLLSLAEEGLIKRNFSEQQYLKPLFDRVSQRTNPALQFVKALEKNSDIFSYFL